MRSALLPRLLSALAIVVCGCDGKRESACSVRDNADGTVTLRCGDQELIVPGGGDGTPCEKTPTADGGSITVCNDGTTIVRDADGNVVYPGAGSVMGRVTLFGETTDHSGTTVRAIGTERSAITDEKGDFNLSGLAAGIYDLLVEREGWEPLLHRNTIAVGGILYLDPLLLRRGRQLGNSKARVYVSPTEDTLMVQEGRSLWLHRVDRLVPVELTPNAARPDDDLPSPPAYYPEGGAVLFLENFAPASRWGRVSRYDIAPESVVRISEKAMDFLPIAGGPALIWRAPAGVAVGPVGNAEVALCYPDGVELALGTSLASRGQADVGPGGRAVALRGLDGTVMVDVDARKTYESGSGVVVAAWSPDGRKAVLASPGGAGSEAADLFLFDLDAGSLTPFAEGTYYESSGPGAISFSRDGSKVLFLGSLADIEDGDWGPVFRGELLVLDTRTFKRIGTPIEAGFLAWGFSPDGASVIYRRSLGSLVHWNLGTGEITALGVAAIQAVVWSNRGDRLAFADDHGSCRLARFDADGKPGQFTISSCTAIHFLPDGERTAVVVRNEQATRELRTWDGGESTETPVALPGAGDVRVRFAPDGSAALWWVQGAPSGEERVWVRDLVRGTTSAFPKDSTRWTGFSPDGSFAVVVSGQASELLVHEVATGVTTKIDTSLKAGMYSGPDCTLYRNFALYAVEDIADEEAGLGRTGSWLSRYPRTAPR